jgi:hypothetical protein
MGTEFSAHGEGGKCTPGYPSQYSDRLWAWWPGFYSRQGISFSLLHSVQTGFGCPPSYSVGTGGSFPEDRAVGE